MQRTTRKTAGEAAPGHSSIGESGPEQRRGPARGGPDQGTSGAIQLAAALTDQVQLEEDEATPPDVQVEAAPPDSRAAFVHDLAVGAPTTKLPTDSRSEAWAAALERGIISKGEPQRAVHRNEAAAIAVRALEKPEKPDLKKVVPYLDVGRSVWFFGVSHTARLYGLLPDHTDNLFHGTDRVGPAEVKYIVRMAARGVRRSVDQQRAPLDQPPEQVAAGGPGTSSPAEAAAVDEADGAETAMASGDGPLYFHGSGMGELSNLLGDPEWAGIMKRVEPGKYDQLLVMLDNKGLEPTMAWMEGDPVLAAYTANKSSWQPGQTEGGLMEWDIWLDPDDPGDIRKATIAHGNDLETAASRVTEQLIPDGPDPVTWMDDFNLAMELAGVDVGYVDDEACSADGQIDVESGYLRNVGVVLEIKSATSTPEEVAMFYRNIVDAGINVEAVASFDADQLTDVQAESGNDINAILFFHGPTELLKQFAEWEAEGVTTPPTGQVMFNLGGLLDRDGNLDTTLLDQVREESELWDVAVGGYFQENDISAENRARLLNLVATDSAFELGAADGYVADVDPDADLGTDFDGSGQGWKQAALDDPEGMVFDFVADRWDHVVETAVDVADGAKAVYSNVKETGADVVETLAEGAEKAGDFVVEQYDKAADFVGDKVDSAKDYVGDKVDSAKEWVDGAVDAIEDKATETVQDARELVVAVDDWVDDRADDVKEAVSDTVNGVQDFAGGVADKVGGLLSSLGGGGGAEVATSADRLRTLAEQGERSGKTGGKG